MLVATAGHVDHGKTSLVQQLTGVDTDRLLEEKKRGLSIELGYAFAETTSGDRIGFIDVPGHKRFINTMIAGVSGIDLALLVVAADDGPMPQTLEHLEIMQLLGVERFVGVISKTDLVDTRRLSEVTSQLSALLPGAPLCPTSNKTGEGLEALRELLDERCATGLSKHEESQFRLYIDRAFSKKGAGLVVTGTALSGGVTVGDTLQLHLPGKLDAIAVRVREVHTQGQAEHGGHCGQRCALNIVGAVSREQVQRGSFLCAHVSALPSTRIDTRCWAQSAGKPVLKHMGRVKLYIGTRRVGARTYLLERGAAAATKPRQAQKRKCAKPSVGSRMNQRVQLILDQSVMAFTGDRFVLRSDDEMSTLCGGRVIDPVAPRRGKYRQSRQSQLHALELSSPALSLQNLLIAQSGMVNMAWLSRSWNLSDAELEQLVAGLDSDSFVRVRQGADELLLASEYWKQLNKAFEELLGNWHRTHPMQAGIEPTQLRTALSAIVPTYFFRTILDYQIRQGQVIYQGQQVQAHGHKPTLSHQVQRDWQLLASFLRKRGSQIPLRSEIMRELEFGSDQLERLVRPAIRVNELFEIGEKRLALPVTLFELAEQVRRHIVENGSISVIEAKRVFGLGRGLTIEILEFLDTSGYTRRRDNAREISDPQAVASWLHA